MVAKLLEQTNKNINGLFSGWGLPARPCDICYGTAALVYCRGDAAFLCGACDTKIHVSTRHERVWMCQVCEQVPATVRCKADTAVLCSSCDLEIHSANPLARRHERVPMVPFIDSTTDAAYISSTTAANSAFFTPNDTVAAIPAAPVMDFVEFELDNDCDTEALLIPNPNSSFSDSYFINSASQKQELTQTRNQFFDLDSSQPLKQDNSVSCSDNGVVPESNVNSAFEVSYSVCNSVTSASAGGSGATAVGAAVAPVLDREARVLRYREKRKNRKFEKTIRYASRKAYAETRPRIKGRFVKRTGNGIGNVTSNLNTMFGYVFNLGSSYVLDNREYGIVPI